MYKSVWTPYSGELLAVGVENGNEQDQYAVVVLKASTWPRELQGFCIFSTWQYYWSGCSYTQSGKLKNIHQETGETVEPTKGI